MHKIVIGLGLLVIAIVLAIVVSITTSGREQRSGAAAPVFPVYATTSPKLS